MEILRSHEAKQYCQKMSELCADGKPPHFADLDLMRIYELAPNITVLDVDHDTYRLKVRFAGTRVGAMFGRETTGLHMDEIDLGAHKAELIAVYWLAVEQAQAQWTSANVRILIANHHGGPQGRNFNYERLVFPMLNADGDVGNLAAILVRQGYANGMSSIEHQQFNIPKLEQYYAA